MIPPATTKAAEKEHHEGGIDAALRPKHWDEYIGQPHVKKNLKILLDAAKKRSEPGEHILFSGPAGLGKTSLAHLVAREMNTNIRVTSGPAIERVGDLASILTNLMPNDILFIDEIHRMNKLIEEVLYPAMESRTLDIIVGKGPSARTIQLELPPFMLVAATTRPGLLSGPLRSRFGASFRLDFYTGEDIQKIILRSAALLDVIVEPAAVVRLAAAARFTPRVANRLLKRARDYADVHPDMADGRISNETPIKSIITDHIAKAALALMEIDEQGLDPMDRNILEIIITKFNGGPVGIQSIAAAASEDTDTLEEVYEPYLMQLGLLERTSRGRVATERAYSHLGIATQQQQTLLT
ncbi:MAG: Holliday junction branch migration DNA helicase RuvB [Candidatus Sungbacteria bacterium]|nr:Holliday junction branch migration DNA helicase RuvB [Candidatus Sungbacteria bacterium]